MRVEDNVLAVLSGAQTTGNRLVLVGQLDRKMYERTNKVLEAIGGKWDKKAKAHVFDIDAVDALEPVLLTGDVDYAKSPKSLQQQFGQFDTPQVLAETAVEMAQVRRGMDVLEPNVGKGSIARAILAAGGILYGVEIDPVRVPEDLRRWTHIDDFLKIPPPGPLGRLFDCVVMNPPFAKQDDIRHVLHALEFLRPDGVLVAIMSAGVTFRENQLARDFRDVVRSHRGTIELLPGDSFKASGTGVNTVLVRMEARPSL